MPHVRAPDETLRHPLVGEGANAMLALKGCVMNQRLADLLDWGAN